ncbi:hypothetical protein G6514_005426, partial [Epicoccum nigrum]
EAWKSSFTKELVKRAFKVVGIEPVNPNVIIDRFNKSDVEEAVYKAYQTTDNSQSVDKLWRQTVKDSNTKEAKKLRSILHQNVNQNEILKIERDDLQCSLKITTGKPDKGKNPPLIQRKETRAKT